VIFPVMRPINIVIMVVTVIESLRAFDLVYITNKGINGLERCRAGDLETSSARPAGRFARRWAGAAGDLAGAHLDLPVPNVPARGNAVSADTLSAAAASSRPPAAPAAGAAALGSGGLAAVPDLGLPAVAAADYCSRCTVAIRPYSDTSKYGYVSLPHHLTLDNFKERVDQSDMATSSGTGADHGARGVIVLALASGWRSC